MDRPITCWPEEKSARATSSMKVNQIHDICWPELDNQSSYLEQEQLTKDPRLGSICTV